MIGALTAADRARFARAGLVPMAPEHGLALLEAALPSPHAVLAPARLDREALRDLGPDLPPVLRGVVAAAGADRPGNLPGHRRQRPLREELTALTAGERAGVLAEVIRGHMAAVLGSRPEAIPDDRPFGELGFDSLTSVEFRNRLNAATDLTLPSPCCSTRRRCPNSSPSWTANSCRPRRHGPHRPHRRTSPGTSERTRRRSPKRT
ncbi:beta-ketoacyl reductase [Streptomyces nogalater]